MPDVNGYHAEAISQAKTLLQFHQDALDTSSDYFAILMEITSDERIDYAVRVEYLNRANEALRKAFER